MQSCKTSRGPAALSLTRTFLLLDMDQLTQIMKVTGVPGPEFIQKLDSAEVCLSVATKFCIDQLEQYSQICVAIYMSIAIIQFHLLKNAKSLMPANSVGAVRGRLVVFPSMSKFISLARKNRPKII